MAEALTGAFLEIAVVEDPGTEETETILTQTTEDVEIERDPEEIDWAEHGNPRMQRREGHESATMSFELIITDDQQNLIDCDVMDVDGNMVRNVIHDEVRIYIYRDAGAAEPEAEYFAEEVQFILETSTFPIDDVATAEMTAWIHDNHGYRREAT